MKNTRITFKVLRWIFIIPIVCLVTGCILLYYLMSFRFKESIRYAVKKETQGRYAFDAGSAELSLWSRTVILKRSSVHCLDSLGNDTYYSLQVPEIYFSIATWKDLLFNRKVVIDSMSIISPTFSVHAHKVKTGGKRKNFKGSDILTILNKTLAHFNAHSFHLQNASFTYTVTGSRPLVIRGLDLSVLNFTKVNNEDDHLLGSDKVTLSLGPQRITLPGERHNIAFRKLTFTSEGQRFEVDSFAYYQPPADSNSAVNVYADKFLFNSRHLPAVYQKDQLLIDTLLCLNPVLIIPASKHKRADSVRIKPSDPLFKLVQVRYIGIINAGLQLTGATAGPRQASGQHANLSIYNLVIDPAKKPQLSTDSVRMNLQKIRFVSRDSMFQISVDEFAVNGDSVLFRNVSYSPTAKNKGHGKLTFTAPTLLLRKVDLTALLQKRLVAGQAELVQPRIRMETTKAAATGRQDKMPLFYQTLHGVRQVIHVEQLRITGGSLEMHQQGPSPLSLSVKQLEADILLHKLFSSDSLVDIKHALPDLRAGEIHLVSAKTRVNAGHFRFNGLKRHTQAKTLQVHLANGTTFEGSGIYWEVFDWDIYQKTKAIQIDLLRISKLTADIKAAPEKRTGASHKDLPVIRIGRLEAGSLVLNNQSAGSSASFKGHNFRADNIYTERHAFRWGRLDAHLSAVTWQKKDMQLRIGSIDFSNHRESVVNNVSLHSTAKGRTSITIATLRALIPLHSSHPEHLVLPYLNADSANADITEIPVPHATAAHRPTALPELSISKLSLANTDIRYKKISEKDTLALHTSLMLEADNLQTHKSGNHILSFGNFNLKTTGTLLDKGNISADIPQATFSLTRGTISRRGDAGLTFSAGVNASWENAGMSYAKDSTALRIGRVTGLFTAPHLHINPAAGIPWQQFTDKLTITTGDLFYNSPSVIASIGNYTWQPSGSILQLGNLQVRPVRSREETFEKARWQGDYVTANVNALRLSGIVPGRENDSTMYVRKIEISDFLLETSRNKQLPMQHGIEKPMPARLVQNIRLPLQIDSVLFSGGRVTYHEKSAKSGNWSDVPLEHINGSLLNINNRHRPDDSLIVKASGSLFSSRIHELDYRESYHDSLSGFRARMSASPMLLTEFSRISMPMAGVSITSGRADTVYSSWNGNKYAASGQMAFFYDQLRVKVHGKKKLVAALETWAANLILPRSKHRSSLIFVVRDREKFIFNYWIKAQVRGIMTTMGIKKNRRYRKEYRRSYREYSLPAEME